MMTPEVSCPRCHGNAVQSIRRPADADSHGRRVQFLDELSRCDTCGEEFYTYDQSLANSRAFSAALREAAGLLTPDHVRSTRIALGMSQSEFERALGVGKKTVVRWERGTVPPSSAANGMLWLASRHPEIFLEYARERTPDAEASPIDGTVVAEILPASSQSALPIVIRNPKRGQSTRFNVSTTRKDSIHRSHGQVLS